MWCRGAREALEQGDMILPEWKELGCLVTTELIQLNDGQREREP